MRGGVMSIDIIYWAMEEAEWPNPIDLSPFQKAQLLMERKGMRMKRKRCPEIGERRRGRI